MTDSNVLYRFFDQHGVLLYIGITMDPPARFRGHRSKEWWTLVRHVFMETYSNRTALMKAERKAIQSEHPQYNVVHNVKPIDRQRSNKPTDPLLFKDYCVKCGTLGNIPYAMTVDGDSVQCRYRCADGHEWTCSFSRSYPWLAAGMG